jgi:hypothetical protein
MAAAATEPAPAAPEKGHETTEPAAMNGTGATHESAEASDELSGENIFLFWPNIIGTGHHHHPSTAASRASRD